MGSRLCVPIATITAAATVATATTSVPTAAAAAAAAAAGAPSPLLVLRRVLARSEKQEAGAGRKHAAGF